jgi:hypothetical protein
MRTGLTKPFVGYAPMTQGWRPAGEGCMAAEIPVEDECARKDICLKSQQPKERFYRFFPSSRNTRVGWMTASELYSELNNLGTKPKCATTATGRTATRRAAGAQVLTSN